MMAGNPYITIGRGSELGLQMQRRTTPHSRNSHLDQPCCKARLSNSMQLLTVLQKKQIVEEYRRRKRQNENATQPALAAWAKEALRLGHIPSQSMISRTLRDADKYASMSTNACASKKRWREAAAPRLEEALFRWLCERNNEGITLCSAVVKHHAERLLKDANRLLPDNEQIVLKFSEGWLQRFKERFGLRFRRVHGEEMSADDNAIRREMPRLLRIVSTYPHADIWNADEFGLFYRQPPSWTLSTKPVSGFKKEKARISFLACCNYTGTEQMPLMIIGNSKKPHAFKGKTGQELGFDYHFNQKAWMTKCLFFAWLNRLDVYVGSTTGRKILLLIDNCSAHGRKDELPKLENVRVEFLPPNTTSKVQPLDAGIIAWVKSRFRRRLLFRVFDNIDAGKKSIYNIDILTAMRWTVEEWGRCPGDVIHNCFNHCFRKAGELGRDIEKEVEVETMENMQRDAYEHGGTVTQAGLQNFLNPEEEDNVLEQVNYDDLVREVAGIEDDEAEQEEQIVTAEEDFYTIEQQLQSLAIARAVLEQHAPLSVDFRQAFCNCQRKLRLEKQRGMKQTTILDHFVPK